MQSKIPVQSYSCYGDGMQTYTINAPQEYWSSQHISFCKKISPELPKSFLMLRGLHRPQQAVVGTFDLCGQWWGHSFFCCFVCHIMTWGFLLLGWVFSQLGKKSCSSREARDEAAVLQWMFHFPALHRFPSLPHAICLASVTFPTLQRWWEEKQCIKIRAVSAAVGISTCWKAQLMTNTSRMSICDLRGHIHPQEYKFSSNSLTTAV